MKRLLPLLCLLTSPPLGAGIYKTIDEEGNVYYSDRPTPGAEKVELPPPTVYTPPKLPAAGSPAASKQTDSKPAYESLRILSPKPDEAIRSNNGDLIVEWAVDPPLKRRQGHRLMLILDGQEVPATGGRHQFKNLDRGTHTLSARILDRRGRVLAEAEPVTFHLLRISIITNPPPGSAPGLPPPPAGP